MHSSGPHITAEMAKHWEKSGRAEFLKQCCRLVKDEEISTVFEATTGIQNPLLGYLYDLLLFGVRGTLKKEAVVLALQELATLHCEMPSTILDVMTVLDSYTGAETHADHTKERTNFCYIVKESEKFLTERLLKERLEIDTLQEVGILKNKTFHTKFIKVKTKLYYKQRKFNLFREESEGFAKLATELNQTFGKNTTTEYLLDVVQSLIGCFNLDPNRVLDVILESFENKPQDAALFIPLIRSYMCDPKTVCEVLGSKFTLLHQQPETGNSKSLYVLTAQLLQYEIIRLDDIYIWLSPEDKSMQRENEKEIKDAKEYVRKLQIISTSAKEKEDVSEERDLMEKYNRNQKLGLCEALLTIGDWKNAQLLMNRLPEHYAIEQQPIAEALCRILHRIIDPVYKQNWSVGSSAASRSGKSQDKFVLIDNNTHAPPIAKTLAELAEFAVPMFEALGPALRYDIVLLYKLIRIGRATFATHAKDIGALPKSVPPLYYEMITLLDSTILPALSYQECNCAVAEEIWTLLKLYPYQTRYCLYGRWKNDAYSIYPDLLRRRADAEKQIKNIMKRVSKENIKPVGRFIGKLTHCSPGFLFDYVLLQIQVYDNLIHPVVDSLKYLTNLSYDVLGYCLVEALSNADKKRVKHDSTSISNWLQSLSSFCGAVFKKYNIELTGLLQYVANQLKAQKSLDLLILKEIVQKMAGIETAEDLTTEQLCAMSGGELLKVEAGYFSQVRNTKKSSLRLKEAMADDDLAVALCLLMAQQKYCVVYRETQESHLKLVGKLSDQCQDSLVQFGTFLGSTFSVDEYVKKLPSIQTMLLEYHIPNEVAFFLARPMFNHAIAKKYDELRKEDQNYKKMTTLAKQQKYNEAAAAVMAPVHNSVIPLHPSKIWEDVSPQLITTFWSLTMYDLHVPEDTYQQAINKIKQQSLANMESSTGKSKKEQERYVTLMEKLQEECRKQQEHVDKVMYRLKHEKDHWFLSRSAKAAKNETITRFLQLCIFPRCTFAAVDAVFCARFVHILHTLKTNNFSTLLCYDRLFCDITYSVTACTENEAMRFGRFLNAMLDTVMHWHKSTDVFQRECAGYPGFITKYRYSNQYSDHQNHVYYENYRHVCHKWHYKLARAMSTCLDSRDYVQIRNALIVLIRIITHFPALTKLAQVIERRVDKMRDEEKNKRQDLYTLAGSYLGLLKQKIQSGVLLQESDFHDTSKPNDTKTDSMISVAGPQLSSVKQQNGDGRDASELAARTESENPQNNTNTGNDESSRNPKLATSENNNRNSDKSEKPVKDEPRSEAVEPNQGRETTETRGRPG